MSARGRRTTQEILAEALVHLDLARQHASGDVEDQLTIDAICMRLSAGIETISRLDESVRAGFFGETWTEMWGMRNRIAHGYLLVEPSTVRSTIDRDVPIIIDRINEALRERP